MTGGTPPEGLPETPRAAYREGYATAMAHIAQLALQGAEGPDGPPQTGATEDGADADTDPDEGMTDCPECGAGLLSSMGADETATPAGKVCPECEL